MPPAKPARGVESPCDVHELPLLEKCDAGLACCRRAFLAETSQWVTEGHEDIGVKGNHLSVDL